MAVISNPSIAELSSGEVESSTQAFTCPPIKTQPSDETPLQLLSTLSPNPSQENQWESPCRDWDLEIVSDQGTRPGLNEGTLSLGAAGRVRLELQETHPSADTLRRLVVQMDEPLDLNTRIHLYSFFLNDSSHSGLEDTKLNGFLKAIQLDLPNQRVIRSDVERTRATVPFFTDPLVRFQMETLLTYFCKHNNVTYKQGMNEVLAPFFYLKKNNANLPIIYRCFSNFVNRFLTSALFDSTFANLQSIFTLFQKLFMYHDPSLATYLDTLSISPELYLTPWFLTQFASKLELQIVLALWDRLVISNLPEMWIWIALALVISNRVSIFAAEPIKIPELLTRFTIPSYQNLQNIWLKAQGLRETTLFTFVQRLASAHKLSLQNRAYRDQTDRELRFSNDVCKEQTDVLFLDLRPLNQTRAFSLKNSITVDLASAPETLQYQLQIQLIPEFEPRLKSITNVYGESLSVDRRSAAAWVPTSPSNAPPTNVIPPQPIVILTHKGRDGILLYDELTRGFSLAHVSVSSASFDQIHQTLPFIHPLVQNHDHQACDLCNSRSQSNYPIETNDLQHWITHPQLDTLAVVPFIPAKTLLQKVNAAEIFAKMSLHTSNFFAPPAPIPSLANLSFVDVVILERAFGSMNVFQVSISSWVEKPSKLETPSSLFHYNNTLYLVARHRHIIARPWTLETLAHYGESLEFDKTELILAETGTDAGDIATETQSESTQLRPLLGRINLHELTKVTQKSSNKAQLRLWLLSRQLVFEFPTAVAAKEFVHALERPLLGESSIA